MMRTCHQLRPSSAPHTTHSSYTPLLGGISSIRENEPSGKILYLSRQLVRFPARHGARFEYAADFHCYPVYTQCDETPRGVDFFPIDHWPAAQTQPVDCPDCQTASADCGRVERDMTDLKGVVVNVGRLEMRKQRL